MVGCQSVSCMKKSGRGRCVFHRLIHHAAEKKPDVAELLRGKTGRVYGDLLSLLTVMKGIPLAYNKDM